MVEVVSLLDDGFDDKVITFSDYGDDDSSENDDQYRQVGVRNPALKYPWIAKDEIPYNCKISEKNYSLRIGEAVELDQCRLDNQDIRKGAFMRVKSIFLHDKTGEKLIRGPLFHRNENAGGLLPVPGPRANRTYQLNEIYMVLNEDADDPRDKLIQGMYETTTDHIVCKRDLVLTNEAFPAYSYAETFPHASDDPGDEELKTHILASQVLVCRFIHRKCYQDAKARKKNLKPIEESIERLTWSLSDRNTRMKDADLFDTWRPSYQRSQRLTFGDAFCGAGGVTQGAYKAGLEPRWGLDSDAAACTSFRRNHCANWSNMSCYQDDITNLATFNNDELYVDIVHASPPCQGFSRANARVGMRDPESLQGQLDEMHQSAMFIVDDLLRKTKARVCMIEESDNLSLTGRHRQFFVALINEFTSQGWSVRYKIVKFWHYGLSQQRKRLVIFASCPGGVLPAFPSPTHGPLLRNDYRTIHDAIGHLHPRFHTLHRPDKLRREDKVPYSEYGFLPHGITCSGTTDPHPNGERKFTLRELACLQGFPDDYIFYQRGDVKKEVLRQIGNAVPPIVAEALMRAIKDALDWEDALRAVEHADDAEMADNGFPIVLD